MTDYKLSDKFSDILNNNLTYESLRDFIKELKDSTFFTYGYLYFDELFYSKMFNELNVYDKKDILNLLDLNKARYSDDIYIEALWQPKEIQDWVKNYLPRKYSKRHVEDKETY